MSITYSKTQFIKEFHEFCPGNFSESALEKLFDYYDNFDENIEFDPVCISCDWDEYSSLEEAEHEYSERLDDEDLIRLSGGGVLVLAH